MERREPRIFRAKPRPEPDPHALAPHEVPVADASSFELGAWTNKAAPQWPYASLVRCALAGPPGETFRRTLSPGEVDGWLAALARGEAVRWLSAAPGSRKSSKLRLDDLEAGIVRALDRFGLLLEVHLRWLDPCRDRAAVTEALDRLQQAGLVACWRGGGLPALPAPRFWALTDAGFRAGKRALVGETPAIHPDRRRSPVRMARADSRGRIRAGKLTRHDQRVAGWALAFLHTCGASATSEWRTARMSTAQFDVPKMSPQAGGGPRSASWNLARAHAFIDEEAMKKLCPDAAVELAVPVQGRQVICDVLIEFQRDRRRSFLERKLRAYDPFLAGWCMNVERYQQLGGRPLVVVVMPTDEDAFAAAVTADTVLTGAVARDYFTPPERRYYPGREHVVFASERRIYHGDLSGLMVPRLPPQRQDADGSVRTIERVDIFPHSVREAAAR